MGKTQKSKSQRLQESSQEISQQAAKFSQPMRKFVTHAKLRRGSKIRNPYEISQRFRKFAILAKFARLPLHLLLVLLLLSFGLGALNCNWILLAFELNPCLKDIKSLKTTKLATKFD